MSGNVSVEKTTTYKEPCWWKNALAISSVTLGVIPASAWVHNKTDNYINKLCSRIDCSINPQEEISIFENAQKVLDKTGLKEKGVEILRAGNTGITDWAPNVKSGFKKRIINKAAKGLEESILCGNNAAFHSYTNKIIMPPAGQKGQWSLFHEIGHAMNFNKGIVGKILNALKQYTIPLTVTSLIIAFLATKKADEEKPNNITQKAIDFTKNNAGKIGFAMFLPTILEEGLASAKGLFLAKNRVSTPLLHKIAKGNLIGLLSYIVTAGITSAGIFTAFTIKDSMVKRTLLDKPQKKEPTDFANETV